MAAVAMSAPAIDFKNTLSFPVRLGASLKPDHHVSAFASIRYNHKPDLGPSNDVSCKIDASSKGPSTSVMSISDGSEQTYTFLGECAGIHNGFVLVVQGEGKDREMVLERLDHAHVFNLTATPSESDPAKLRHHPQISLDDETEDALFGDEQGEEDVPIDPSNPFDYRLLARAAAQKAKEVVADPPRSTVSTPTAAHARQLSNTTSQAVPRPAKNNTFNFQAKRKAPKAAEKPSSKRVKAGPDTSTPKSQPARSTKAPKPTPTVPQIRMERKATIDEGQPEPAEDDVSADADDDDMDDDEDDGELILENDAPPTTKTSRNALSAGRNAMSLALSGQLNASGNHHHGGPISFRSAASSPAAHLVNASPLPPRPHSPEDEMVQNDNDDDDDDDDGDELATPKGATPPIKRTTKPTRPSKSSHPTPKRRDKAPVSRAIHPTHDDELDELAHLEQDDDDDITNAASATPAAAGSLGGGAGGGGGMGGGDDEDDLDKMLAAALGEDEGPGGPVGLGITGSGLEGIGNGNGHADGNGNESDEESEEE